MECCPIQGVFRPYVQCCQDRLWTHCDPGQDKTLTGNELINKYFKFLNPYLNMFLNTVIRAFKMQGCYGEQIPGLAPAYLLCAASASEESEIKVSLPGIYIGPLVKVCGIKSKRSL